MASTLDTTESETDIIGLLLRQQRSLTAVEAFSDFHDQDDDAADGPAQEKYYRRLLPASPPAPDQQFGFEVDLDKCSGCKACVVACHTLNGLEEDESWRRVGTITIGSPPESNSAVSLPAIQHVTTACHHCEDPGCLYGCPVKAYDKDPVTGIVRHLDDQCIGCKYCTMMCPYEVPRYSERLGIVRKCDMCHQRLSAGEAPACVQACPNEAIAITVVQRDQNFDAGDRLSAGAPVSSITRPSTRYRTDQPQVVSAGVPQDAGVDEVAESHWPLAVMLVATQASVGIVLVERMLAMVLWLSGEQSSGWLAQYASLAALLVGGVGLNIAPLHLGQPLRAWRVFLGLRTSWLSREAIILGKYMGLLTAAVALLWLPVYASYVPQALLDWIPGWAGRAALILSIPVGIAGLYSSAMIYIATKRTLWRSGRTLPRFLGSALVLGLASVAGIAALDGSGGVAAVAALTAAVLSVAKLVWEWRILMGRPAPDCDSYDRRSNQLARRELGSWITGRTATGWTGALLLLLGSAIAPVSPFASGLLVLFAASMLLFSELSERLLYFCSVVYDRMPGTL